LGSIPDQILNKNGKVLQIGTDILTYVHFLEQKVGVPYRFLKRFYGNIVDEDRTYRSYTDFYAREPGIEKLIPDPIRTKFYSLLKNSIAIENKQLRYFQTSEYLNYSLPLLKENKEILINKGII
jgi:aminoglycoside N3'-acetyltransferase